MARPSAVPGTTWKEARDADGVGCHGGGAQHRHRGEQQDLSPTGTCCPRCRWARRSGRMFFTTKPVMPEGEPLHLYGEDSAAAAAPAWPPPRRSGETRVGMATPSTPRWNTKIKSPLPTTLIAFMAVDTHMEVPEFPSPGTVPPPRCKAPERGWTPPRSYNRYWRRPRPPPPDRKPR